MRTPPHTPKLFRTEKDAVRLYKLYLIRLQMNGVDEETVAACAEIRRHAGRTDRTLKRLIPQLRGLKR